MVSDETTRVADSGVEEQSLKKFFLDLHDHLAPRLDPYEQAVYLYAYRHSRLVGKKEVLIQMTTARGKMASSVKGEPMSQKTVRDKLRTLRMKGCLDFVTVPLTGTRIRVKLPSEVPGVMLDAREPGVASLDVMDFYTVPENRLRILFREERRCFYCLRDLGEEGYVIEHVEPLRTPDDSYRNVVASCSPCNNRKGRGDAEDLLRALYREGLLSSSEFQQRASKLARLRAGELRPPEL
jgi:hypothetical protein